MTLRHGRKCKPPKAKKNPPILQQNPNATPEAVAKARGSYTKVDGNWPPPLVRPPLGRLALELLCQHGNGNSRFHRKSLQEPNGCSQPEMVVETLPGRLTHGGRV